MEFKEADRKAAREYTTINRRVGNCQINCVSAKKPLRTNVRSGIGFNLSSRMSLDRSNLVDDDARHKRQTVRPKRPKLMGSGITSKAQYNVVMVVVIGVTIRLLNRRRHRSRGKNAHHCPE